MGSGLATAGRVAGAVAGPVIQSLAEEESGQAPEIQAERQTAMKLQQQSAISSKREGSSESQLEMGIKYGTLNRRPAEQYVDAIATLYITPIAEAQRAEFRRSTAALHPGGATYSAPAPALASAVPEGGTAAMDAELMRKRLKPNYQPYKLEDGSIVNVDIDHQSPPDGAIPVNKLSQNVRRQSKTFVSKKLGGPVSGSYRSHKRQILR